KKNKNGSSYRIAISFFLLCVSILLLTNGKLSALAGVYTIAFLSVMALFGIGNILLKIKRKNLPRPEKSSWLSLLLAISAVIIALVGNVILNPAYLGVFMGYFIPAILLVMIMLNRTLILKIILQIIKYFLTPVQAFLKKSNNGILQLINKINSQEFVYFTKDDDVEALNMVMLYIKRNEHTKKIKVVSAFEKGVKATDQFVSDLDVIDREYPAIKIEYIQLEDSFGPDLINRLSKEWGIPVNFMFIGSPGNHFPYKIEQLGGVRLII
ncbi:MAG: APC family permease, partial [Flavobacteriaceae bacterium]|nr:APC family permease [Flavobacteriaceae bacterium]